MKTILGFLIFSGSFMGFLNAEEQVRYSEYSISEKTYIDPSRVHFMEGAICVNIDDLWVLTPAVHADCNGYYIDSFQLVTSYSWKCSVCGKTNENYHLFCKRCGRAKS